eukprot:2329140-Pyramimonas_sp.AAC.1
MQDGGQPPPQQPQPEPEGHRPASPRSWKHYCGEAHSDVSAPSSGSKMWHMQGFIPVDASPESGVEFDLQGDPPFSDNIARQQRRAVQAHGLDSWQEGGGGSHACQITSRPDDEVEPL